MKGHPSIKQHLNQILKNELTAINQFFLHARMCRNWGLESLNDSEYKASIKAMKIADKLIERIFFLDSLPNLQALDKLFIGEDVPEIFHCDLKLRQQSRKTLVAGICACEMEQDYVTRDLLNNILEEIEEQIDRLETQQNLVDSIGLHNFLQAQL